MNTIKIRKPNDFHHHLRDGEMLKLTAKECFDRFNYAIIMPNTVPPITTVTEALDYKKRILKVNNKGTPLMTLYLNKNLSLEELKKFKDKDSFTAVKYYPKKATTNSQYGIENIKEVFHILQLMEELNIPLLVHGESIKEDIDIFHKEKIFLLEELTEIIKNFKKLRIVLEHISSKESVDFVIKNNIYATITPHHLILNRNDIFKNGINPHHYCLPILKKEIDRKSLVEAALSGKKNFFLGTDSAPHLKENKLNSCGCAGIFNCTVAVELITELFYENRKLENLEKFISTNGCDFYNLDYNNEYIYLQKKSWIVPKDYNGVVPLFSGEKINWKLM